MRLKGQIKCGFYPAPNAAIDMIAARLIPPKGEWTLLDPCAGEGDAVLRLAHVLACPSVYAIELDEGRAETLKTRENIQALAPANCLGCKASTQTFSLVWLNPPYDHEIHGGRTETLFFHHVTPWIKPAGILCLVCPEHVQEDWRLRDYLCRWYERISVMPFPEHCRQYEEVVVFAVKRQEALGPCERVDRDFSQAAERYRIPPGTSPKVWEKVEMTDAELDRALASSPITQAQEGDDLELPSPPLALGTGHIALLLAAGQLDGLVKPDGEPPHVVRGQVHKEAYVSESTCAENADGGVTNKTVISEKIVLSVRAVGPDGIIHDFGEDK